MNTISNSQDKITINFDEMDLKGMQFRLRNRQHCANLKDVNSDLRLKSLKIFAEMEKNRYSDIVEKPVYERAEEAKEKYRTNVDKVIKVLKDIEQPRPKVTIKAIGSLAKFQIAVQKLMNVCKADGKAPITNTELTELLEDFERVLLHLNKLLILPESYVGEDHEGN